jgi:hypothetical protein
MHPSAHLLSAFSAHQVHLTRTPRGLVEAAMAPGESSPIVARASQARSSLVSAHPLIVRCVVVAIGWALLGIYCAEVFSTFSAY